MLYQQIARKSFFIRSKKSFKLLLIFCQRDDEEAKAKKRDETSSIKSLAMKEEEIFF